MAQYFTSFIEGMRSTADLFAAQDDNRRKNAQAERDAQEFTDKRDAAQRQLQTQERMGQIMRGEDGSLGETSAMGPDGVTPVSQPTTGPGRATAPQRESQAAQQQLTTTTQRAARLRELGEYMIGSGGSPKEGRAMLQQAIAEETGVLDQKIKTLSAEGQERDYVAAVAQGVYDQPSFTNAIMTLMSKGYPVDGILKSTGGTYSPQAQQAIDSMVRQAMSAKQAADVDLAVARDAQTAQNIQSQIRARERSENRADQTAAFSRSKIGAGPGKAQKPGIVADAEGALHKESDLRQEYKMYLSSLPKPLKAADMAALRREARPGLLPDFITGGVDPAATAALAAATGSKPQPYGEWKAERLGRVTSATSGAADPKGAKNYSTLLDELIK